MAAPKDAQAEPASGWLFCKQYRITGNPSSRDNAQLGTVKMICAYGHFSAVPSSSLHTCLPESFDTTGFEVRNHNLYSNLSITIII